MRKLLTLFLSIILFIILFFTIHVYRTDEVYFNPKIYLNKYEFNLYLIKNLNYKKDAGRTQFGIGFTYGGDYYQYYWYNHHWTVNKRQNLE